MKTKLKIGCFIPSRTTSSRLPNKALALVRGKPIIQHVIERAKLVSSADVVVLCTSTDKSDDRLVTIAQASGVKVYRGSLIDVAVRFLGAADKFGVGAFAIFSGDNVFTDPAIVNQGIKQLINNKLDFINIPDDNLVCGAGCYCILVKALRRVCRTKNFTDTEYIRECFLDKNKYKVQDLKVSDPLFYNPKIRLTLDYPEDLALVSRIFDEFNTDINNVPLKKIVELIKQKPKLASINFFRHKDWADKQKARKKISQYA